jgi:hypothetical protein
MAITYTRKERLPSQLGGPFMRPNTATAGAIVDFGRAMQGRIAQLKEERDETIATNAYNEFQQAATERLYDEESGLLNQKGESIYNLDDQYNEWFNKFKGDYMAKRFDTDTQAQKFEEAVDADQQRDLQSISKHIMREHNQNKKNSIDKYIVGAESKIRATPGQTDEIIKKTNAKIDKTYPHTDNSVQHALVAGRFRSAQVQEVMDVDAGAALKLMENEQIKKELGEAYHTWKKKAEAEQKKQLYNATIAEVRKLYPGDYNKQEDAIKEKGLDPRDERSLVSTIRGDETEARERENEFKKEGREKISNDIYGSLREKNYGDALEMIKNADNDFLSEREKFNLENQINGLINNPATGNDPAADNYWFERIRSAPYDITQAEKDALATDRRLTTSRRGQYLDWLDRALKGDSTATDTRLKPMLAVLKTKWNNKLYLSEDERADYEDDPELAIVNQRRYQQDKMDLVEWAENNPDANILDYYGKEQIEEVQRAGWWERLNRSLRIEGITPSGIRFDQPIGKPPISPLSDISQPEGGEGKTVVRTGVHNGRPVRQFADGSKEYAD